MPHEKEKENRARLIADAYLDIIAPSLKKSSFSGNYKTNYGVKTREGLVIILAKMITGEYDSE